MNAKKEKPDEKETTSATMSMTKKELAQVAGYTYRRLYDINQGLPDDGKLFVCGNDGKYSLEIFVRRWVRYNVDRETGDDQSLDEVKAIHEKVKTRKTEIEVAKMEGSLVDVTDVRRLWGDIANTVMQNMIRLSSTIAPQVVMMESTQKIASIIETAIHETLDCIADTPIPSYALGAGDDEESEDQVE